MSCQVDMVHTGGGEEEGGGESVSTFLFGSPVDDTEAYVDGLLVLARDALADQSSTPEEITDAEELLAADREELIAAMRSDAQPSSPDLQGMVMNLAGSDTTATGHSLSEMAEMVARVTADAAVPTDSMTKILHATKHGFVSTSMFEKWKATLPLTKAWVIRDVAGRGYALPIEHPAEDPVDEERPDDHHGFILPTFSRADRD